MQDYQDYELADFLADERFVAYCFQTDDAAIAHWQGMLDNQPHLKPKVEAAQQALAQLQLNLGGHGQENALSSFKELFYAQQEQSVVVDMPKRKQQWWKWVAAAAAIVIGVGIFQYWNKDANQTANKLVANNTVSSPAITYSTNSEERKVIDLPDGSKVQLNYNSTMTIEGEYGQKERLVRLQGEAFFEVAKDKTKPFRVMTASQTTEALGTAFLAREYTQDGRAQTWLLEGKVAVENQLTERLLLAPGEKAISRANKEGIEKSTFNRAQLNDWRAGKLVFNNDPIDRVFDELSSYYGIPIVVKTTVQDKHFTGTFENQPLSHLLEVIGLLNKFRFTIDATSVTIEPK
jgi:transmembrane sensor